MPIQSFDDFSQIYETPQIDDFIVGFSGIDPQKKREVVSLSSEQLDNIKQLVLSEISTKISAESNCICDNSNLSDEQKQIVANILNNKILELILNIDSGDTSASNNTNNDTFSGTIQHKRGSASALINFDYVPRVGELLVAVDTGEIRVGDGIHIWANLPQFNPTKIVNSYNEKNPGKALDATKGKELNERVAALESISSIDYGEITASENNGS